MQQDSRSVRERGRYSARARYDRTACSSNTFQSPARKSPAPGICVIITMPQNISSTLQTGDRDANLLIKVVEALSQCLTKEQDSNIAPFGFNAALKTLFVDSVTSPFLQAGFQA